MTLFWPAAAALTAGVVIVLVMPLLRRSRTSSRRDHERLVYRDQLAELERERERGLIDGSAAEAARAELARRLLNVDRADACESDLPTAVNPTQATDTPRRAGWRVMPLALAVLIPVGAAALYAPLGRPDLPGQPLAARSLVRDTVPPEMVEAVARLADRLAQAPDDLRGWMLLGQSYARLGRPDDSLEAWRRAKALAPDEPTVANGFAEALVMANQGLVPDEARLLFEGVLAKQPGDPLARYYLALGRFQAGDRRDALDRWVALAADTPAEAPWLPLVKARIVEAAAALGVTPPTVPGNPAPQGPSTADMAAMAALPPAERMERIRGMVAGLAARLETDPTDVEGWLRLAQAYQVLGAADKRLAALAAAERQAPQRVDVLLGYAIALMEASDRTSQTAPLPDAAVNLLKRILVLVPNQPDALWFSGQDAANRGDRPAAIGFWQRLLDQLDPASEEHRLVQERLTAVKSGG